MVGIRSTAIAGAVLLMLFAPSAVRAHPKLKRSEPSAGAVLPSPPSRIELYFSEVPELAMTTLSLRGPHGAEALADIVRDAADPFHLTARIPTTLLPGRYAMIWRTAASDGHPTQGSFEFTIVGSAAPSAPELGSETSSILGPEDAPGVNLQSPFQVILRALTFVGVIMVIGAVAFRNAVVPRIRDLDSDARAAILHRGAVVGAVAAAVLLVLSPVRFQLQAIVMHEHATGDQVQMLMLQTRWGATWILSTVGAVVSLAGFLVSRRRLNLGWLVAAAGAVALAFSPALSGHAGASPRWTTLSIVVDALHIIGAAGWLGSLLYVVVVGLPTLRTGEDGAPNVARLINAFSPTALAFASVVVATGVVSAWLRLGVLSALWTSQYGLILLLKLLVLSGVAATGAYNWRRVKPALGISPGTVWLQGSAGLELAIGLVVIVITAILVATPTPLDGG